MQQECVNQQKTNSGTSLRDADTFAPTILTAFQFAWKDCIVFLYLHILNLHRVVITVRQIHLWKIKTQYHCAHSNPVNSKISYCCPCTLMCITLPDSCQFTDLLITMLAISLILFRLISLHLSTFIQMASYSGPRG